MHYYSHNIGDYRRDTAHLSLLEHGVYRQMLDQYYLTESPLTLDREKLMRSLCVRNAEEVQAFENVLSDFFERTENGYVHKRCDEELERVYAKSQKARQAAKKRWGKQKQPLNGKDNADDMQTHTERNADGVLPINPLPNNPITQDQNKGAKAPKKFTPPSVEEVRQYCQERGNNVDPESFVAHYEANGWYRGKTKIKDWKSCVITWEKRHAADRTNNQQGRKLSASERATEARKQWERDNPNA